MANLTGAAATVPVNSILANYCQIISGCKTAGYVIGEALTCAMGAGIRIAALLQGAFGIPEDQDRFRVSASAHE
jgi:hypothetical protein